MVIIQLVVLRKLGFFFFLLGFFWWNRTHCFVSRAELEPVWRFKIFFHGGSSYCKVEVLEKFRFFYGVGGIEAKSDRVEVFNEASLKL